MTDETIDHETAPATPPADPAALAFALIALITDPKGSEERLKKLTVAHADLTKRQKIFVAAQAAHAATVADDLREREDAHAAIRKRELKVAADEGMLKHREAVLEAELANPRRPRRLVDVGQGVTREFDDELDERAPFIAGDDSAVPNPQNNLPLLPKRSWPRTGRSRRLSGERFGASSLTRDAG